MTMRDGQHGRVNRCGCLKRGGRASAHLAQRYGVHPTPVYAGKKQLRLILVLSGMRARDGDSAREGRSVEGGTELLGTRSEDEATGRRVLVDDDHDRLSIWRQCGC